MKAIVCHAPEDLRLDNFETDVLGTHQLQVDVAYGGICVVRCKTSKRVNALRFLRPVLVANANTAKKASTTIA